MSALASHGPVVKPMSPEAAIPAYEGCHESNGFLSVGGGPGCSSIHFLPLTAPGRNNNPSSAIFENACSVLTMSCSADCPCATTVTTKIKKIAVFISSNPWLLLLSVAP